MNLTPHDVLLPLLWLANGLLAALFLLAQNALALLLLLPLGWLLLQAPPEQRPWTLAAAGMALSAAALSPQPVPALLLLMAFAGAGGVLLERFNPAALRWRAVGGIALYALMGVGFSAYQLLLPSMGSDNALLAQGQRYLNVLISIAMYFYPLGFLALLAQAVWVHPPLAQSPEGMIHTVRSRGKS